MKDNDASWKFLLLPMLEKGDESLIESELLDCVSYSRLIPDDALFGHVIKSIFGVADLCVSSDTGPLHIALCKDDLPVVGLWNICLPWAYDEPRNGFVNVISKNVLDNGLINMVSGFIADGMGDDYQAAYNLIISQGNRMEGREVFASAKMAMDQCSRLAPVS
jgi:hypothetical protein